MSQRPPRVTRRHLLRRATAAVGLLGAAGAGYGIDQLVQGGSARPSLLGGSRPSSLTSEDGFVQSFHSRPDLHVPTVTVAGPARSRDHVFLGPGSTSGIEHGPPHGAAQQGALIVDGSGGLTWSAPQPGARWVSNVRLQSYRGSPAVTYWEGRVINPGFGQGEGVILDSAYRELARVRAGNGRLADLHEFRLTSRGTALITCFPETVTADLSAVGGPYDGTAIDSIFQEVDIATGRVLLEWHGLDHIGVSESYQPYNEPYDYLHVNALDVLPDGNLLIGARATFALYKLDRTTGEVIWRLGGKRSDFAMGPGARFSWQHDSAPLGADRITVFDDGAGPRQTERHSRGLVLALDESARAVRLAHAYVHPEPVLATAMGSVQMLDGGDVFVGWGTAHYSTAFAAGGAVRQDFAMRDPRQLSYRAYRYRWRATPRQPPALVARTGAGSHPTTLYASWNGATEVAAWQVHAGTRAADLRPIGTASWRAFETAIPIRAHDGWFRVTALDAHGRPLGRSRAVRA